jgi:hypothetical protein
MCAFCHLKIKNEYKIYETNHTDENKKSPESIKLSTTRGGEGMSTEHPIAISAFTVSLASTAAGQLGATIKGATWEIDLVTLPERDSCCNSSASLLTGRGGTGAGEGLGRVMGTDSATATDISSDITSDSREALGHAARGSREMAAVDPEIGSG